jgi:hypothetical protein
VESLDEDRDLSPPAMLDLWPVIEKSTGRVVRHCGLLDIRKFLYRIELKHLSQETN